MSIGRQAIELVHGIGIATMPSIQIDLPDLGSWKFV